MRTRFSNRLRGLVTLAALGMASAPGLVSAQSAITSPPPVRSSVDANGVDLVTGVLTVTTASLTIGQGEGMLTYARQLIGGGWVDNMTGTISSNGSGGLIVSIGGASELFTLSGGTYVNAQGGGSTLSVSGGTYTYTTALGAVATFQSSLAGAVPAYALAQLTQIVYPDGRTITYTFASVTVQGQSASRVQSVNNNFGYQLKFTYQINSPTTASQLVQWSTVATVTGINNTIDYCSPSANSCTGFTQPWPTLTYGTSSTIPNATSVTDAVGNVTNFIYGTNNQLTGVLRPGASATTTNAIYNSSGQVIEISNGFRTLGPVGGGPGYWHYSYALSGGVETTVATDPLGHTRTVVSSATTLLPSSDTDGLGRTTSYLYDSFGRLTQLTWPEGNYVVYAYDGRGNLNTLTSYPTSGSGQPSIQTTANFDTTCVYVAKCNQPNWIKDGNGNQTSFTYDQTKGVLLSVTGPPPTAGAVQPQASLTYQQLYAWYKNSGGTIVQASTPVDLLTQTSACATTASCSGTSDQVVANITYGSSGVANNLGPTATSSGPGNGAALTSSSLTYDAFGNVATTVGPLGASQTSAYFWDADRQPAGVIGPEPSGQTTYLAQRYTFSANGQPTLIEQGTTTSQASLSTFTSLYQQSIGYDGLGRQIGVSLASGGTTQSLTQYSYDNANRLVCAAVRMNSANFASPPASACLMGTLGTGGQDRITLYGYDAANELTSITNGYLSTKQSTYATKTYTANGYVQTVKDAMNNLTTIDYDGFDRAQYVYFPSPTQGSGTSNSSDYESYAYDSNGNLTTKRLRSGDTVSFTYDALNRLTQQQFASGGSQPVFWGYDLLNRMLYARTGSASGPGPSYVYDALGRVTSTVQNGRTLSYAYDAASNRTGVTWPDTGSNALTVSYLYDSLNNVTQVEENGATSGPGLLATYAYDTLARRASIARAGGTGLATTYSYGANGLLASVKQALAGSAATTLSLGYNTAGQISARTDSNGGYTVRPAAVTSAYATNGLNQYTSATGVEQTYNPANAVALGYDAQGGLQTETVGGTTTTFLYDGPALVGEYSSSGTILNRYVMGPGVDEPLTWYSGAGTSSRSWYAADNLGSVIATADQNANAQATYDYGPYGEPITSAGAPAWGGSRFRYTGQIEIPNAQTYFYKARVYDPFLGRFYQTDPVGLASDVNLYAYATEDPINGTDPTGHVVFLNVTRTCQGVDLTTVVSYGDGSFDVEGDFTYQVNCTNSYSFGPAGGFGGGGSGVGGGGGGGSGGSLQNNHPKHPSPSCRPATSVAANIANVADNISNGATAAGLIFGGGALASSETGVGGIGFGALSGGAFTVSTFATVVEAVANLVAGRYGNLAVNVFGLGFGGAAGLAAKQVGPTVQLIRNGGAALVSQSASSICPG